MDHGRPAGARTADVVVRRDPRFAPRVLGLAVACWALGFISFTLSTGTPVVSRAGAWYLSWGLVAAATIPSAFRRHRIPTLLLCGTAVWCGGLGVVQPVYQPVTPIVLVALFGMTGVVVGRHALIPAGITTFLAALPSELRSFERATSARLTSLAVSLLIIGAIAEFTARHEGRLQSQVDALLDELRHAAGHDDLTLLANRRTFRERLRTIEPTPHEPFAVVLLDLDHFKDINDHHGHETGDRVLRYVATQLGGIVRDGELAARLGGDEFALVLRVDGGSDADALETAKARVAAATAGAVETAAGWFSIEASIGAVVVRNAAELDAAVAGADDAMYLAKRDRRTSATSSTYNTTNASSNNTAAASMGDAAAALLDVTGS